MFGLRFTDRRRYLIIGLTILFVAGQFPFFNIVRDQFRFAVGLPSRAANGVTIRLANLITTVRSVNSLSQENANLRAANNIKEAEIAQLKNVQNENASLRTDLNFARSHPELRLIAGSIISFSPTGVEQVLVIDRGSDDGIKEEQAVVAQGFLIGKVKRVSNKTAEIWLLANRNLLTPVRLTGSQTTGILSGGIRGMVVENIPVDTKVEKGEPVVTSNLEGLYPAGIAVGQVEEIISRQEEIFISARISSPVAIGSLSQILVVSE